VPRRTPRFPLFIIQSPKEKFAMTYTDTRLLIDNEWVDATGGKTLDVVNPATGKAIGKVAHASIADLDRALAAAQRGFEKWRNTPPTSAPP
jgi:succinate-semialdehyde dehydrogenase/glutarate-semialdehyde dehydrogenase